MSYQHRRKWGAGMKKKTFHVEPHMYSAAIASVREEDAKGPAAFWRSKTRCSSQAEWMELHDATDGSILWRAEARYADRAVAVGVPDARGREVTEFLTCMRLYLESETAPRLMIVHRDNRPGGLHPDGDPHCLSVYTLDPAGPIPGVAGEGPAEQFDFAAIPEGEDVFQIRCNNTLSTMSLCTVSNDAYEGKAPPSEETEGLQGPNIIRHLAKLKRTPGVIDALERTLEVDKGLDVPLVSALLLAVDQLMVSHEAIDYDVDWPEEYGLAAGECFSSRKTAPIGMSLTQSGGTQTGSEGGDASGRKERACFCF